MLVAADHEERTGTPPAVLVEVPPNLDPLHGCGTFVAGRRGERDELCSGHSVSPSLPVIGGVPARAGARHPGNPCVPAPRVVLGRDPSLATRGCRCRAHRARWTICPCQCGSVDGSGGGPPRACPRRNV